MEEEWTYYRSTEPDVPVAGLRRKGKVQYLGEAEGWDGKRWVPIPGETLTRAYFFGDPGYVQVSPDEAANLTKKHKAKTPRVRRK